MNRKHNTLTNKTTSSRLGWDVLVRVVRAVGSHAECRRFESTQWQRVDLSFWHAVMTARGSNTWARAMPFVEFSAFAESIVHFVTLAEPVKPSRFVEPHQWLKQITLLTFIASPDFEFVYCVVGAQVHLPPSCRVARLCVDTVYARAVVATGVAVGRITGRIGKTVTSVHGWLAVVLVPCYVHWRHTGNTHPHKKHTHT
jgi:hypothetical protein